MYSVILHDKEQHNAMNSMKQSLARYGPYNISTLGFDFVLEDPWPSIILEYGNH